MKIFHGQLWDKDFRGGLVALQGTLEDEVLLEPKRSSMHIKVRRNHACLKKEWSSLLKPGSLRREKKAWEQVREIFPIGKIPPVRDVFLLACISLQFWPPRVDLQTLRLCFIVFFLYFALILITMLSTSLKVPWSSSRWNPEVSRSMLSRSPWLTCSSANGGWW